MNIPVIDNKVMEIEKRMISLCDNLRALNDQITPDTRLKENDPNVPPPMPAATQFAIRTSDTLSAIINLQETLNTEILRLEKFVYGSKEANIAQSR